MNVSFAPAGSKMASIMKQKSDHAHDFDETKLVNTPELNATAKIYEEVTNVQFDESVSFKKQNSMSSSSLISASERRQDVLQGGWCTDTKNIDTWQMPSRNLLVFVSSTFTDTHAERNVLMEKLLPLLQQRAKLDEVSVTFVDMRYGVRDENTLDHKTWYYCARELERCRSESAGLFFLSLQGDKYGYRPLPRNIPQVLFEERASQWLPEHIQLALQWYKLDENAQPPEYVLKNLANLNDSNFWNHALPILRPLLSGLPFDEDRSINIRIGQSVTDWETKYALSQASSTNRCVWLHRHFDGEYDASLDLRREISDVLGDDAATSNLQSLKTLLAKQLSMEIVPVTDAQEEELEGGSDAIDINTIPAPKGFERVTSDATTPSRYISIGNITLSSYISRDLIYEDYIKQWEETVKRLMGGELNKITTRLDDWKQSGCGLGIPGIVLSEMLHHCQWAATKFNLFKERKDLVQAGMQMLLNPCVASESIQGLQGLKLAIVGISGSGKTSLMAKLAAEMYQHENINSQKENVDPRPVIIRFCGTSSGSNDGLALVQSICQQIAFLYGEQDFAPALTYSEVVAQLHVLLGKYPIILFIDSLDQLGNAYLERSRVSFLQDVKPHPDTVIVVSTLPDERDPRTGLWKYCYQCEARLKESSVPILTVSSLGEEAQTQSLMQAMLSSQYSRTCSSRQWSYIMQQTMVEPTALYLQLACRVISSWSSFEMGCELSEGVQPLIAQIFANLERDYGVALTRAALGYITYSVEGISDDEMQDLLSLHDGVIDEVFQYSALSMRRLPFHVWARLRSALEGLIVEKQSGCLKWYHRQLQEAAERRYEPEMFSLKRLMGLYFGNYVDEDIRVSRLIATQPLLLSEVPVWLPYCRINRRRCAEAAFQLVGANLYEEAAVLLCNMEEICACVKSGFAIDVLRNLVAIESDISPEHFDQELYETLSHYVRWLRTYLSMINENPTMNIPLTALQQPAMSRAHQDMLGTIEYMKTTKLIAFALDATVVYSSLPSAWLMAKRFGVLTRFGRKLSSVSTYAENVAKVCFSPDGQMLATALSDRRVSIWDRMTGLELVALMGHTKAVLTVAYSHDGRYVASASYDCTVRIWEVTTGTEIHCFKGHSDAVTSVVFTADDRYVLSASYDSDICVWDLYASDADEVTAVDNASEVSYGLVRTIKKAHDGSMICGLALSPDQRFLASRGLDYQLKIWNIESDYALETTLFGLGFMASTVTFSPDGRIVASGGDDNSIMLWETETWSQLPTLVGHTDQVYSVAFSPDSKYLVAGDQARLVKVWHVKRGKEVLSLEGHSLAVYSVSFSPDGKLIASGSSDSTIAIWDAKLPDIDEDSESEEIRVETEEVLQGHHRIAVSIALRPHTGDRLVSGSYDKLVKFWDTNTGAEIVTVEEHRRWVNFVCFSRDGQEVLTAADDGKVLVCDADTGEVRQTICEPDADAAQKGLMTVAISPCGRYVATGANDARVRFWDKHTSQLLWTEDTFDEAVAIAAADAAAAERQLTEGQIAEMKSRRRVSASLFSSDGRYLAIGSFDSSIHVWEVSTREKVYCWRKEHKREVMTLSGSRCGRYMVSASRDKTVCVWDLLEGRRVHQLCGHRFATPCAIFTPDSSRVISISVDKTIKIWCMTTGIELNSFVAHHQSGYSLAISDDGKHLYAGYGDGIIVRLDFLALSPRQEALWQRVRSTRFDEEQPSGGNDTTLGDLYRGEDATRSSAQQIRAILLSSNPTSTAEL